MNHDELLVSLRARLWDKVDGPWVEGVNWDDCWYFNAGWRSRFGYGRIREGGRQLKQLQAHIVAFEQFFGKVAPEHVLRHACAMPLCCNPFHLVPGTYRQNRLDQFDDTDVWAAAPMSVYA